MIPTIQQIPIDALREAHWNARKRFDADELKQLALSIGEHGLMQPLIVRPAKDPEAPEVLQVVDGARRFRSIQQHPELCELADEQGQIAVACILRPDLEDDREAEILSLTANLERVQLDPVEEARGIARLVEAGVSIEDLAKRLSRTRPYVARRAKLSELPADLWDALDGLTGRFGVRPDVATLELLALLPADRLGALVEDEYDLLEILEPGNLRAQLAESSHLLEHAPWGLDDETLVPEAGACAVCPARSDHQPELYEGLDLQVRRADVRHGNGPLCIQTACWERKLAAHAEARIAAARAKHGEILLIEGHYDPKLTDETPKPKGILGRHQVDHARKGDEGAVRAVIARGKGLGTVCWVRPRWGAAKKAAKQVAEAQAPAAGPGAKPKPKPPTRKELEAELAEREAKLEAQRAAWRIDQFLEDLDTWIERPIVTVAATAQHAVVGAYTLARIYGCEDAFGAGEEFAPAHKARAQATKIAALSPEVQLLEIAQGLWEGCSMRVRDAIAAGRRVAGLGGIDKVERDAGLVAHLLCVPPYWAEFEKRSVSAIATPKVLEALRSRLADSDSKPAAKAAPAKKTGPLTHAQAVEEASNQ